MATTSTIAIELQDGTVKQVYCHWDGDLNHNGRILFEHYTDPAILEELINLGNISSLGPTIGEKHPFDGYDIPNYKELYGNMTTFYGRDREEKNANPSVYSSYEMYRLTLDSENYDYIFRNDGKWYWKMGGREITESSFA